MKQRILPSLFSCLLLGSACKGTEVGNGVRPTVPSTSTATGGAADTASPSSQAENTASDKVSSPMMLFPDHLVIACASPFAEPIAGKFVEMQSLFSFMVSAGSGSERLVSVPSTLQTFSVSPDPTAGSSYAIAKLSFSPNLSCGPVSSQTLGDGSIERKVTLSDQTLLSWILVNQTVTSIQSQLGESIQKWSKTAD